MAKIRKMPVERVAEIRAAYQLANKTVGFESYAAQHAARAACIKLLDEALTELERRSPAKTKSGGPQIVLTPRPFFDFLCAVGLETFRALGLPEEILPAGSGFNFAMDLAACPDNALCARYFTEADNALSQSWHDRHLPWEWLWNNPPFGTIAPWVELAHSETILGARPVQLLKMAMGADWFQSHIKGGPCTVIRMWGRLPFVGYGGAGANFDTMLLIWHGGAYQELDWDWRADLQRWFDATEYPQHLLDEWGWKRWKGRKPRSRSK